MKWVRLPVLCAAALLAAAAAARAQTVSIAGLYATGVDNTNTLLGSNTIDSHYVVTASSLAGNTGNAYTVKAQEVTNAGWTANLAAARWLVNEKSGGGDGNNPSRGIGTFDYQLTFTMPVGAQLNTVLISGSGAADNSATIYVNGTLVSGQSLSGSASTNSFTLDSTNAAFVSGSNTITFRVNNTTVSPTGLLISTLSGTAVVPEVGAFLPVLGALVLVGAIRIKRRRQAVVAT
jgi:hypothetical protein